MQKPMQCLSEYQIDCYLLDNVTVQERKEIRQHLDDCPACSLKVQKLQAKQAQYHPIPHILIQARELDEAPKKPKRPFLQRWTFWFPWAAVAACLGLFWWHSLPTTEEKVFRPKGPPKPRLHVALQRGKEIRLARSGEFFFHKDLIRIGYQWELGKRGFVFVLHRDRHNKTMPLFPMKEENKSLKVISHKHVPLPGGFELDEETQGSEEIWACFSLEKLGFQEIVKQLPPQLTQKWPPQERGRCTYLLAFVVKRGR